MLSVTFIYCYAECHFNECHYAECCYAECRYAECHYAECHYAECRYAECRYADCRYAECRYAECRYAECRGALKWSHFDSVDVIFETFSNPKVEQGRDNCNKRTRGQCYKTFLVHNVLAFVKS